MVLSPLLILMVRLSQLKELLLEIKPLTHVILDTILLVLKLFTVRMINHILMKLLNVNVSKAARFATYSNYFSQLLIVVPLIQQILMVQCNSPQQHSKAKLSTHAMLAILLMGSQCLFVKLVVNGPVKHQLANVYRYTFD